MILLSLIVLHFLKFAIPLKGILSLHITVYITHTYFHTLTQNLNYAEIQMQYSSDYFGFWTSIMQP